MILLHASPSTNAQQRIQDAFSQGQYRQASATSPFLLHAMIIGTYLDNWRWFLYDYGKVCMDTVCASPPPLLAHADSWLNQFIGGSLSHHRAPPPFVDISRAPRAAQHRIENSCGVHHLKSNSHDYLRAGIRRESPCWSCSIPRVVRRRRSCPDGATRAAGSEDLELDMPQPTAQRRRRATPRHQADQAGKSNLQTMYQTLRHSSASYY